MTDKEKEALQRALTNLHGQQSPDKQKQIKWARNLSKKDALERARSNSKRARFVTVARNIKRMKDGSFKVVINRGTKRFTSKGHKTIKEATLTRNKQEELTPSLPKGGKR